MPQRIVIFVWLVLLLSPVQGHTLLTLKMKRKKEREMEAECDEETTRSFVRSVKGGFQLNVRADMVLVERLKADILDCKSACGQ